MESLDKRKNKWREYLKNAIEEIITNDIDNFHNNYIFKLLEINNKYVDYIEKLIMQNDEYYNEVDFSSIKKIDFYSIININPEYRFISDDFKKYINKLIYYLNLSKKYVHNYGEVNKDILRIKKIIHEIKNNSDLQKINEASYQVYEKYKNRAFRFQDKFTYDKYYLYNIIEILYLNK